MQKFSLQLSDCLTIFHKCKLSTIQWKKQAISSDFVVWRAVAVPVATHRLRKSSDSQAAELYWNLQPRDFSFSQEVVPTRRQGRSSEVQLPQNSANLHHAFGRKQMGHRHTSYSSYSYASWHGLLSCLSPVSCQKLLSPQMCLLGYLYGCFLTPFNSLTDVYSSNSRLLSYFVRREQQHEQLSWRIREKEERRVKFWQGNDSKQLGVDFQAVYFLSMSKKIVTIMSKYLKGRFHSVYFLTVPILIFAN